MRFHGPLRSGAPKRTRWPDSHAPALLVALIAGCSPRPARRQDSPYLKWDPATKTVTFELIAGAEGAKSPFNFNGYTDGEANLVVPPGANVVMNFVQKDGTPHSAELIADKDPMPNLGGDPRSRGPTPTRWSKGCRRRPRTSCGSPRPDSGSYRIFCGVPGHGLSGMWIRFKVDPAAKAPSSNEESSP